MKRYFKNAKISCSFNCRNLNNAGLCCHNVVLPYITFRHVNQMLTCYTTPKNLGEINIIFLFSLKKISIYYAYENVCPSIITIIPVYVILNIIMGCNGNDGICDTHHTKTNAIKSIILYKHLKRK